MHDAKESLAELLNLTNQLLDWLDYEGFEPLKRLDLDATRILANAQAALTFEHTSEPRGMHPPTT